jgi:hypothetical protein
MDIRGDLIMRNDFNKLNPSIKTREGLDQILLVAKERAQTLDRLRRALLAENDKEIKFYASEICGLKHESNRVFKSFDKRTKR